MKISRENYEIWFAGWFEDQLTRHQQEELKVFLDENPDLREEFYEIAGLTLNPPKTSFSSKEKLKKNSYEIPEDQFDLLCAASFEGDLGPDQLSELSEITGHDPARKKTAALMALTRLTPPLIKYPFKRSLYRRTERAVILRMAIPVISIAATIALLLMTGIFRKHISPYPEQNRNTAQAPVFKVPAGITLSKPDTLRLLKKSRAAAGKTMEPSKNNLSITAENITPPEKPANIIPVEIKPSIQVETAWYSLANGPFIPSRPDEADDERSRIGKFLARTLREKVLEEKNPSSQPLKGYEIAEAGITGINKLLGWEMALIRNTDDEGQSSVNFNSRLLKFNTPVKNNEQGE